MAIRRCDGAIAFATKGHLGATRRRGRAELASGNLILENSLGDDLTCNPPTEMLSVPLHP